MGVITHEQLQAITGKKNVSAIENALKQARIPFRRVGNRLFSTESAVTAVMTRERVQLVRPKFEALKAPLEG